MDKLQTWFIIVTTLLGIGVPCLFISFQFPDAANMGILSEAVEYAILDEDNRQFWAEVPGKTEMVDEKLYYIFNCTNPEEVAIRGATPKYIEVGPFKYTYTQNFIYRDYTNEDSENSRVSYVKSFSHKYEGNINNLTKEYRVINLSGMKKWANIKRKERFQLAIEGFFETFRYSIKIGRASCRERVYVLV